MKQVSHVPSIVEVEPNWVQTRSVVFLNHLPTDKTCCHLVMATVLVAFRPSAKPQVFIFWIDFWWWRLAAGRSLRSASCRGGWGERSCPSSATAFWSVAVDRTPTFQLRSGLSSTELSPLKFFLFHRDSQTIFSTCVNAMWNAHVKVSTHLSSVGFRAGPRGRSLPPHSRSIARS